MKSALWFVMYLGAVALAGCHHRAAEEVLDDGRRGTRVTNPRPAPWVFFRGDESLLVDAPLRAGDTLETLCAYNDCGAGHRYLSVWRVDEQASPRLLRPSTPTHPEREHRFVVEPGNELLVIAWTTKPLLRLPFGEVPMPLGKATPHQGLIRDDVGREMGVVQWGRLDRVR